MSDASKHLLHRARSGLARSLHHGGSSFHQARAVVKAGDTYAVGNTSASTSASSSTPPSYTNEQVLLGFLAITGGLAALFVLAALPRLLARWVGGGRAGEVGGGFVFRRGAGWVGRPFDRPGMSRSESDDSLASEKSYSGYTTPLPYASKPSAHRPLKPLHLVPTTATPRLRVPPYFPSFLPTVLIHPLPRVLHRFSLGGLTLGQAFVLVLYGSACALATFWYSVPTEDASRSGVVATAQIPLIVALGMKNSPVVALLGKGSEKVNFLHRFLGRSIFIGSTLHAAVYFAKWDAAGISIATKTKNPIFLSAFISYLGLCVVSVTSIPIIRRKAYEFFTICHFLGYMSFMVALIWHAPLCVPFCLSGLGLWVFDQVFRLLLKKSVVPVTAVLTALDDGETTLLEIPSLTTGWRAGQYVNVRILPGTGMGVSSLLQKHPFTIGSAPAADGEPGEGIKLYIKAAGGWTRQLYGLASSVQADWGRGLGRRECRVLLDGPYGGTGNMLFAAFSSVMLVAGGSGISAALSMAQSLLAKARNGGVRARKIDLCWVVRDEAKLVAFIPHLLPLLDGPGDVSPASGIDAKAGAALYAFNEKTNRIERSVAAPVSRDMHGRLAVAIHVYVTRATPESSSAQHKSRVPYHPRLVVHHGRPSIATLVDSKVDAIVQALEDRGEPDPCGLAVGVCGPASMVVGVREAIGGLNARQANAVGGVELFTESFGM